MTRTVERSHCATTTLRRARKRHRCDACEAVTVEPGQYYLLHKGFPGHDALSDITAPMTMVECRACAERYARGHLLPSDPLARPSNTPDPAPPHTGPDAPYPPSGDA